MMLCYDARVKRSFVDSVGCVHVGNNVGPLFSR
jgi:hypothetical protein